MSEMGHVERIWVPVAECRLALTNMELQNYLTNGARGGCADKSSTVLSGDWDLQAWDVERHPRIRFCRLHWEHGLSWEQAGAYDYIMSIVDRKGSHDGCRNIQDVIDRYARLDKMYRQVLRERKLRPVEECHVEGHSRSRGVLVHIGRNLEPIFGCRGFHRFACAKILNLDVIPADVGVVHAAVRGEWRVKFTRED